MPSEVAAFSGRGFDMLRMVTPQSVSRSYSGIVQASDTRHRSCPTSNTQMYSIPPPVFHKNLPPLASSPKTNSNYLSRHSHIPSASPNSPSTPTKNQGMSDERKVTVPPGEDPLEISFPPPNSEVSFPLLEQVLIFCFSMWGD